MCIIYSYLYVINKIMVAKYFGCLEAVPMATARWAPARNILAVAKQCLWLRRDGLPHGIFLLSWGSACGCGAMGSCKEYIVCRGAVPVAAARWAPARNIFRLSWGSACGCGAMGSRTEYFGCRGAVPVAAARWAPARNILVVVRQCVTTQAHSHTSTHPHNHTTTQLHNHTTTQPHNDATTQPHTPTQPHNHTTTHTHTTTPPTQPRAHGLAIPNIARSL